MSKGNFLNLFSASVLVGNLRMCNSFKFGQIEVTSKEFQKQRQVTDILMINVNKVVFSDGFLVCHINTFKLRYLVGAVISLYIFYSLSVH